SARPPWPRRCPRQASLSAPCSLPCPLRCASPSKRPPDGLFDSRRCHSTKTIAGSCEPVRFDGDFLALGCMDPGSSCSLTDRDTELLRVLTHRVRVLTEAQAARTFWSDCAEPVGAMRPRIDRLREAGFIDRFVQMVHPELDLAEPLVVWQPG